jgi:arylsulfatase
MNKKYNILLIFPDQHRGDWLGDNPDIPLRTPNLNNMIKHGVKFTNAISPSPLCAPARACLATGMDYHNCRVPDNNYNLPMDMTTFYSILKNNGYHVMGSGKFDLHKRDLDWGQDGTRLIKDWGFSSGIDNEGKYDGMKNGEDIPKGPYIKYLDDIGLKDIHIEDYKRRKNDNVYDAETLSPHKDESYSDNWIGRNTLELLSKAPKDSPWFMQVNFNGPHEPYDITEGMNKLYENSDFLLPDDEENHSKDHIMKKYRSYASMIENIDSWVGTFKQTLQDHGELENTLIVYASDHGEMLGEQNLWGKCVPYHPSVHVPLIISGPDCKSNVICDEPVTLLDLTATFLEVAGVVIPDNMDSMSLFPILKGDVKRTRRFVYSALSRKNQVAPWRMVFEGRYKFIEWNEEKFLFDLRNDPYEKENLITYFDDIAKDLEKKLPLEIRSVMQEGML